MLALLERITGRLIGKPQRKAKEPEIRPISGFHVEHICRGCGDWNSRNEAHLGYASIPCCDSEACLQVAIEQARKLDLAYRLILER